MVSNFADALLATARRVPDRDALVVDDRSVTYDELADLVRNMAVRLRAVGVRSGDVVAVILPNEVDFAVALAATAMLGVECLTINTRLAVPEIDYVLGDARAAVVITSGSPVATVDLVEKTHLALQIGRTKAPLVRAPTTVITPQLVILDEPVHRLATTADERGYLHWPSATSSSLLEGTAEQRVPSVQHDELDPFLFLYTSGTTSKPKGCRLDQRAVLRAGSYMALRLGLQDAVGIWNPCPLFHVSGAMPFIGAMLNGGTYITQRVFEPESALKLLAQRAPAIAYPAFPSFIHDLFNSSAYRPDSLGSLTTVLCTGPIETLYQIQQRLPQAKVINCYGITEAGGTGTVGLTTDEPRFRIESAGLPKPALELQIRDRESNAVLDVDEAGALWVRGPDVIREYVNAPQATKESFDAQGWFSTGDLGSLDKDGRFYYHGRIKDTLKVGGENVAALEVESFLASHPAVQAAAVIGVPDARLGEVPVAFVEFRPGLSASEAELIAFSRANLAKFKVPRHVRAITEWPMSSTKVQKFRLRDMFLAEMAGDGGS